MNINSTEDERYKELKDRTLTIIPWDETKPFIITDPSKSLNRCIVDFVKSLGLLNKRVLIPNINYPVKFNKNSLNESIASMCRHQANLLDLAKLFTVFDSIIANSIEIQDEEYRHADRNKAKDINCMRQYLSGFCDKDKVYPVKITVEERQIKENTFIYVVVTVGVLDRNKMKEALPNVRVHSLSNDNDESLSGGVSSFDISIADFAKFFNRSHSVIIKNLPNKMLSEEQIKIKRKVIETDYIRQQKNVALQQEKEALFKQIKALREKERQFDYEPDNYDFDDDYGER